MSYRDVHLSQVKPSGFARQLIAYLTDRLSLNPRSLLDIGCGTGGYTKEWGYRHPYMKRVVGVDLDPPEIAFVKTYKLDLSVGTMACEYDVVFSKSVLEHLDDAALEGFARNMKKCLKASGVGIVMVPDWKTCKDVFYDDYTHVRPWTQQSLKDWFTVVGLDAEVEVFWQVKFAWEHPLLWKAVRRLHWAVRDQDLKYRMKHAALLAIVRQPAKKD